MLTRLLSCLLLVAPTLALAVPLTIDQQGRILKIDGTPETTSLGATFAVYDSATGGSPLWSERHPTLGLDTSGFYTVSLGTITPFPSGSTLWDGRTLYLGITLDGDVELAPRESVQSVPYALRAGVAEDVVGEIHPATVKFPDGSVLSSAKTVGDIAPTSVKFPDGTVQTTAAPTAAPTTGHGQCRLVLNGTGNSPLTLIPFNGNQLLIGGVSQKIPKGLTMASTGLSANTTYYIYATMSGTQMVLAASATSHVLDDATGVEVESGDATRTLVGMARTNQAGTWESSHQRILVLSWFNRRHLGGYNSNEDTGGVTSAAGNPWVEVDPGHRVEFLTWSDDAPFGGFTGFNYATLGATSAYAGLFVDFVNGVSGYSLGYNLGTFVNALYDLPMGGAQQMPGITEGYHYANVYVGYNGGSGTGQFAYWITIGVSG